MMQPGLPPRQQISNITDTRFFPQLTQHYGGDILIINLLRPKPGELDHLSLEDVKIIVREIRSKAAILTPLGMTVLRARSSGGVNVIAASDGLRQAGLGDPQV